MSVLITGPGRAGSTALAQLFRAMGFVLGDVSDVHPPSRAGLEGELDPDGRAEIIKNPRISFELRHAFQPDVRAGHGIEAVLVPLRELDDAVASRARAALASDRLRAPGAFFRARTLRGQRAVVLGAAYRVAFDCADLDVPVTFIAFPRLATDPDYCFRVLRTLPVDLDRVAFDTAWSDTMDVRGGGRVAPLTTSERARLLALQTKDLWDVVRGRQTLLP